MVKYKSIFSVLLLFLCLASSLNLQGCTNQMEDKPHLVDVVLDHSIDSLIDELSLIKEPGFGYSSNFSGSQFLPFANSENIGMIVFGGQAPKNSSILEQIVRMGVDAIPSLLSHLDDDRLTDIPVMKGMMWTSFDDEYDYNKRTITEVPKDVNKSLSFNEEHPREHKVTIGDLCFVALGQIVNRDFNATRYQPSGGLVVSSTSYSEKLCATVRAEWEGVTKEEHRDRLILDFNEPDWEERRIGAYYRLAFFYPTTVEPLLLDQLKVPTYNVFTVSDFVKENLYTDKASNKKEEFDQFIHEQGLPTKEGVEQHLFQDLYTPHQREINSPSKDDEFAQMLLPELFGYENDVTPSERPFRDYWSESTRARFIEALCWDESKRADQVVFSIFKNSYTDDYTTLSCMKRLIGRGYDPKLKEYCIKRMKERKDLKEDYKDILQHLEVN